LTYASGLSSTNYAFNAATSARSYTVNPAVLNITLSKTYDGTTAFTKTNTYTLSGTLYNSDAMPTIASGTAATASANAASYTSFASNGLTLSNTNYTLTNGTVATTINPAPLGIAIGGVYSGSTTITPATYTITGLVSAQTLVPTSVTVSNANVSSNGANYVTAILSKTGTATLSNYAITTTYNATSATNTTNTVTLSAAPLGLAVTGTYSGLYNLVPSSVVTEGLLGSDTLTGLSSVTLKYKDVANNGSNFVLSATGVSGTAVLSNYAITAAYNTASTTTKNIATLTAAPLGISVTAPYSGSTVILTPTIDENKTFGLVNGETLTGLASVTLYSANVSANGSNYVTAASGAVGTATLSNYSLTSAYNNADTSTRNKATITPAILKVTAVDSSKFVTQSDPVGYGGIIYSGWVAGQGASVLDVTGLIISRSDPSVNAATTYTLIPSGLSANAGNYTFNYQAGTFTIIPADTLAVSVAITSSVYGTAPTYVISSAKYLSAGTSTIYTLSPTVTGSVVTMTDGAGGSATFTLTPISTSGASSITSGSGNYKVDAYTLSATNKTIVSNNFSNSIVVTGSLTVAPLGLNASNLSVAGLSKVYDGTTNVSGLALSASSDSFVNGDTVSVIGTGNFADTNVASSKAITITPALSGADASNYYFSGADTISTSGTITQLASVTYDGLSGGNWSNASNWTGGAIPTLSNVGIVIIPTGKTVVYDTANLIVLTPTSAITANGILSFTGSTATTFANTVSGTGSISQSGTGALTLTGINTYSGGTTLASGSSLIAGNSNALGTGALTSAGGTFSTTGGTLSSLTVNGAVTLASDITSSGNQIYNGALTLGRSLTLDAGNSYITFNNNVGHVGISYENYVAQHGANNIYNLTVLANRININADITTYGTQTYGSSLSYTSVYIGDNGTNGRIRTLVSEDPAVTFWGTIDDATANTHDLDIKAVCYLSCAGNDLPTIDFKSDIGLIAPLLSLEATTGRQETTGSPTFAQTSLNSNDYVGNVSIMGDVTTKLNQTYTGKKINLGDGTSNQIQTFATTGGNVRFNYGTDGTIPSNNSLVVKFDLNGGTHTILDGVNVLEVSNTSSNSNIIDGGQILKTILNMSSNRQLPISKDGSYMRARVDVLDPIFKCNSQVTTKECI
jgi:hypothetical protein